MQKRATLTMLLRVRGGAFPPVEGSISYPDAEQVSPYQDMVTYDTDKGVQSPVEYFCDIVT